MKSIRKWVWIAGGGAIAIFVGGIVAAYLSAVHRTIDDFQFLGGRSPVFRGVELRYPTAECRYYSWKADFKEVREQALRELAAAGFTVSKFNQETHFLMWKKRQGMAVALFAGRTATRDDLRNSSVDPSWVTVGCDSPLPDNWMSHLRLALEPYP